MRSRFHRLFIAGSCGCYRAKRSSTAWVGIWSGFGALGFPGDRVDLSQTDEKTLISLAPEGGRRRSRMQVSRRAAIVLGAVALVVAAVVVVVASGAFGGGNAPSGGETVDNGLATSLATVSRRSLSSQTQVSATLGYADPSTVVVPSGTMPQDLGQAQQAAATAQAQLKTAKATLATDAATLDLANASLSADRAKLTVDCSGDNAGESAASSPAAGANGGGSGSTPCATDSQSVSTDEQSVAQAKAKVAADRQAVSSATTGLAGAETSLSQAEASATVYGESATYTELPAVGRIVGRGKPLYEISGRPVVVLFGSVAPWRAFMAGMSPGRDVAELNANLAALGYGTLSGDAFTAATASAVDRFEAARGLSQTGRLPLGSVVFEPGPVRVTSVIPTLGASVQAGPVLGITSTARQVTIALDAAQQSQVKVGDRVVITLPDNSTTPGKVSHVGSVATIPSSSSGQGGGGGSSSPTIEVDVTPTNPAATGHLDQAPVNVSITTASVKDAIVVPVNALLALASGGYAVEAVGTGGTHHLVGVQLGLFDDADGLVQITGTSLSRGQRIVVPSQ